MKTVKNKWPGALILIVLILLMNMPAVSDTLTILHANDFHGRYMPFEVAPGSATSQTGDPGGENSFEFKHHGVVGGLAVMAAAVDSIRKKHGKENVLLVHAGDTYSDDLLGNITKGEAMVRLMNKLGFDFMAFGNHDFDYTLERTRELQEMANFPMRAANIIEKGKPIFGDPVAIVEKAGIKVGLLALGYHNTPLTTNPENVKALKFINGIDVAQQYVDDLHKQADIVVVVSHQGTKADEMLLKKVNGIDVLIGGHSHDEIAESEQGAMAQSLADAAVLGEINIILENGRIQEVKAKNHVLWDSQFGADPQIARFIDSLRAPFLDTLEMVVGTATERIERNYMSESPFDKLVGNILREKENSEIALLTGVGYGISIPKGKITREQVYTLIPHSSKIVTLQLSGKQILKTLEQSAWNINPQNPMDIVGGLIQTSGMKWSIDFNQPRGKRISAVEVGGQPLEPRRLYSVVTHSGILAGAHRYNEIAKGKNIIKKNEQLNEAIVNAFKQMGTVSPPELGDVNRIEK